MFRGLTVFFKLAVFQFDKSPLNVELWNICCWDSGKRSSNTNSQCHIKLMIEVGMKNIHEHDALATYHISHTWSVPGRDVAIESCSYIVESQILKVRVAGILVSAPNKCHTHINHVAWTKITITMLPRLTYHWSHTRCVPASQIQIATASTSKQTIKRCHLCHIPHVNGAENMIK